ncbi:MAG TPA: GrpB family protein [Ktedonobacterales bacterium]|nr:GrpB family protein [Ktedonobacterales bacterium]
MNARKNREIVIVDYRPEWPDEFAHIAARLRGALGDVALRIDHIGSTAVPGLAAKDIIDVQVTVAELNATALDPSFARIGCARAMEIDRDHVPPTITDSDQNWRKLYYRPPADMRPTHIHVRQAGSANGRYPLLFRDYLRTHSLAAAAYAQAKVALARNDSYNWDLYYDIKDPVCDIIMAGAEDWAAQTGWRIERYA